MVRPRHTHRARASHGYTNRAAARQHDASMARTTTTTRSAPRARHGHGMHARCGEVCARSAASGSTLRSSVVHDPRPLGRAHARELERVEDDAQPRARCRASKRSSMSYTSFYIYICALPWHVRVPYAASI